MAKTLSPPKIIIQTDQDFTPAGARRLHVMPSGQIRAYVSGRRFRTFATAAGAIAWRDNVEKLAPQPWDAFRN